MIEKHEIVAMVRGISRVVKDHIASAIAEMAAIFDKRLNDFDSRLASIPAGPAGPQGIPGESIKGDKGDDADPEFIRAEVARAVAAIPPAPAGQKGDKGDKGDAGESIRGEPGPAGKDGADVDPVMVRETLFREVDRAVAALPKPANGKDADPLAVMALVDQRVALAVAAIPPAKDGAQGPQGIPGESIKGEPGVAGPAGKDADPEFIRAEVAAAVAKIPPAKDGAPGAIGDPGKDAVVDYDRIGDAIKDVVAVAIREIPKPKDGRDGKDAEPVDQELLRAMVSESVSLAVAQIPKPADGKDGAPGPQGPRGETGERGIDGARGEPGPAGQSIKGDPGESGKDADPEFIRSEVARAVAEIPRPRDGDRGPAGERGPAGTDGKDATDDQIMSVLMPELDRAIAALPKPKDGKDGASIHPDTIALMVREAVDKAVAAIPKTLAADGRDGRDALAIDILPGIEESKSYPRGTYAEYRGGMIRAIRNTDPITAGLDLSGWTVCMNGVADEFEETIDEGRTIKRTTIYTNGRQMVREIKTRILIYRGVWTEGEHEPGDVVTWGGSAWHCQENTRDKPGASTDWKMIVKEGRPGKDGKSFDAPPASAPVVRTK